MKFKLYDLIGIKSGMNFYLEAFCRLFNENDIETQIISNFPYNKKAELPNIFISSKVKRVFNLLFCYYKLLRDILRLRNENYIIILVYGLIFDIPLILLAKLSKRVILDVHEVISLDNKSSVIKFIFFLLYKTCPNQIISHSEKTNIVLAKFSYKKKAFLVPHFHYNIDLNYNVNNIDEDVINLFKSDSKYFLFFGNLRASKGVMHLIWSSSLITDPYIKIIIAGQDVSGIVANYQLNNPVLPNVKFVLRHINDDELKLMFTKSYFILLPYEEISQSGVIEMAIAFRKPVLTSNIEYFKRIIEAYPSFGKYIDTKNHITFSDNLLYLSRNSLTHVFFDTTDLERYFQTDAFEIFLKSIKEFNLFVNSK